ncbi:MAG: NAD(P)(+) transhydrogenase (Re/Si-specific) subunit beta [Phycisphaerales bacterium]|nr:NAD(P)(+) transhydrogenase (Re/Si-specific) subunit beta [Phycisphaerales bacterium]MCB9854341.1 NAD(P)(+) transhydrogenase (Re/Si-specific) subunit beta [Phycisphaerales bacterium]MCB9863542.1 NAD(P)(+) transhydrogenase (Re/Si-specific) subunit beta [Phycisphaerales bacterium]
MLAVVSVQNLINLAYLVAAVLFIYGLKGLTHPRTAVRGNLLGALAMLIAVVVTLWDQHVIGWSWICGGIVVGSAIGAYLAVKVEMTGMPELVALYNGFGGIASVLVAGAWLLSGNGDHVIHDPTGALGAFDLVGKPEHSAALMQGTIAAAASGLIGGVTLLGSLVAYGKLAGIKWVPEGAFLPQQKVINAVLVLIALALCYFTVTDILNPTQAPAEASAATAAIFTTHSGLYYTGICIIAFVLGVTLVTPIGGADMPVVIALLNSYSGLAAAATGFVINNNVLIIAGSLVGASGLILTSIMCKAMNRSLWNVMFATMGPSSSSATADEVYAGKIKSTSGEEIAMLLETARRVVIIPGYGMAVSQAQHAVRDLANLLESKFGANVDYAIHPVAGRMPGHMNVLLAEANIPYDKLREMDNINPEMDQVDVAIVIGANDVVNPVARTDPKSPIAGMPIIDADKARTVIVIKRSLSPGYAGIPNPLFAADNALMFFADGKKAFQEIIEALKEA